MILFGGLFLIEKFPEQGERDKSVFLGLFYGTIFLKEKLNISK